MCDIFVLLQQQLLLLQFDWDDQNAPRHNVISNTEQCYWVISKGIRQPKNKKTKEHNYFQELITTRVSVTSIYIYIEKIMLAIVKCYLKSWIHFLCNIDINIYHLEVMINVANINLVHLYIHCQSIMFGVSNMLCWLFIPKSMHIKATTYIPQLLF